MHSKLLALRGVVLAATACAALAVHAQTPSPSPSPSPSGAEVYIIEPADGAVLGNPVTVRFGLRGMGVAPAGVERPNTGHHHLLIDVDKVPVAGEPIPADDKHRHFGGGQTEVTLELPSGKHTLQLLLADHLHRPHDPPVVSRPVTITVR